MYRPKIRLRVLSMLLLCSLVFATAPLNYHEAEAAPAMQQNPNWAKCRVQIAWRGTLRKGQSTSWINRKTRGQGCSAIWFMTTNPAGVNVQYKNRYGRWENTRQTAKPCCGTLRIWHKVGGRFPANVEYRVSIKNITGADTLSYSIWVAN